MAQFKLRLTRKNISAESTTLVYEPDEGEVALKRMTTARIVVANDDALAALNVGDTITVTAGN